MCIRDSGHLVHLQLRLLLQPVLGLDLPIELLSLHRLHLHVYLRLLLGLLQRRLLPLTRPAPFLLRRRRGNVSGRAPPIRYG